MPEQQPQDENSISNQDSMIDIEYEDRLLPCALTDRERLELGENIAKGMHTIEMKQMELKAKRDVISAEISTAQERVSDDSRTIRVGKVDRMSQCQIVKNYRIGSVRVVRMDTNETIESRPMTSEERQQGMKF